MNFLFISIYRYIRFGITLAEPKNLAVVFMCILNMYEAYCIASACEITMEQVCEHALDLLIVKLNVGSLYIF